MNTRFNGDPDALEAVEDESGVDLRDELRNVARAEALEAFRRFVRVKCEEFARSEEIGQLARDAAERVMHDAVVDAVEARRHELAILIDAHMRTPGFRRMIRDLIASQLTPAVTAELLSIPTRIARIVKRRAKRMT